MAGVWLDVFLDGYFLFQMRFLLPCAFFGFCRGVSSFGMYRLLVCFSGGYRRLVYVVHLVVPGFLLLAFTNTPTPTPDTDTDVLIFYCTDDFS